MRICIVGKFPPIAGGVSHQTYLTAHELARRGHAVSVVTNAGEVETEFRALMLPGDAERIEAEYGTGAVRRLETETVATGAYVPWAQPFASKLFGRALAIVEDDGCDLLVGWYLEPYGLAAAQVSAVTGLPLVLRHAGSDIGRLARQPDLRRAYTWALRHADRVLTTPTSIPLLRELGADPDRLVSLRGTRAPEYYRDEDCALDVAEVREHAGDWWAAAGLPNGAAPSGAGSPGGPTIGLYGKLGESKGSFDLLEALDELAREERDFEFLALVGGHRRTLAAFVDRIRRSSDLGARTTLLPFLAPWRVPAFLRRCDLTCFLERGFDIATHGPRIPQEVMLAGSCLVCSREVVEKQYFAGSLVDRRSVLVVDDPRDHGALAGALAWALEHPGEVEAIAARGRSLLGGLDGALPAGDGHADAIEDSLP